MGRGPSTHLTWRELACHDDARTPYPHAWRGSRAVTLAAVFEAIREACGSRPVNVLSAYRTPAHNRVVGGARHSQHVEGRALDLRAPEGLTTGEFYAVIRELASGQLAPQIGGLGRYARFVHVDTRPRVSSGRLAAWSHVPTVQRIA